MPVRPAPSCAHTGRRRGRPSGAGSARRPPAGRSATTDPVEGGGARGRRKRGARRVRREGDRIYRRYEQRCRRTADDGLGNTSARWRPAGHRSMYSGPVSRAWSMNGGPCTTSLTVAPRNHGTLLPAAPQAQSIGRSPRAPRVSSRRRTRRPPPSPPRTAPRSSRRGRSPRWRAASSSRGFRAPRHRAPGRSRSGRPPRGRGSTCGDVPQPGLRIGRLATATTTSPARSPAAGASLARS